MQQAQEPLDPVPAWKHKRAVAIFLGVFAVMLAGDLLVKAWSFKHVAGDPVPMDQVSESFNQAIPAHPAKRVVPGVLALKLTVNQGAVFGLFPGQRWVFICVTVLAIGLIGYFFGTSTGDQWPVHLALGLILAGALGNLYDRIMYLCVRDMLYLFPGVSLPFGWKWPGSHTDDLYPWIFNLADVYLLVGILIILVRSFRQEQLAKAAERQRVDSSQGAETNQSA